MFLVRGGVLRAATRRERSESNYSQVSAGATGHAEVVQVEFDPAVTSYEKLVDFFWKTHDPTDGRGVAPDFGKQYRPNILYRSPEQKAVEVDAAVETAFARRSSTFVHSHRRSVSTTTMLDRTLRVRESAERQHQRAMHRVSL
jgi:methionine-S-sulfoxide reductase